jgi:hypothetical protein
MVIFDNVTSLADILRVESLTDYPQIADVLIPAAEKAICDAVGTTWITANATDPTVVQLGCVLVATWFNRPEAFGELTPGANFMLTQLQARALDGDAVG